MATVLLVEDETCLLDLFGELLHRASHTVLIAPTAECAIQAAQIPNNAIDILICDVLMGRTQGFEIAATVRATHPQVFVILMSGSPPETFPQIDLPHEFLQKPFTPQQFLEAISQATPPAHMAETANY